MPRIRAIVGLQKESTAWLSTMEPHPEDCRRQAIIVMRGGGGTRDTFHATNRSWPGLTARVPAASAVLFPQIHGFIGSRESIHF